MSTQKISLRYGCNPNQTPAQVYFDQGVMPLRVLNGEMSYINVLDALNSWQLVRELHEAIGLPAATSFKHVSPAGAAVGIPLSDELKQAYGVADLELSPVATAYAKARGSDRLCSFGDWVAVSEMVDESMAHLLKREVSDGIIAPGYESTALEILSRKKQGKYVVLEIDPQYEPPSLEKREVFGITLEQKRNDLKITRQAFSDVVTKNKELTDSAIRDLLVAMITLKYTQSNSVCFALDGQTIGVGAGQQSRVHCTQLAGSKTANWWLRQHPQTLNLPFRDGIKRPERDNAIDLFLRDELNLPEKQILSNALEQDIPTLPIQEKREWLEQLDSVALCSDGFIPFRDSIDCAAKYGVKYVVQPGGSLRDDAVVEACDEYGMAMVCSGIRLFHH